MKIDVLIRTSADGVQILGSVVAFQALRTKLLDFIGSDATEVSFDTAPDNGADIGLLSGFVVRKTMGSVCVSICDENYLDICGSSEFLLLFFSFFDFDLTSNPGDHQHPEYVDVTGYMSPHSISVVVEIL